jgi:hypothetical protein
MKLYAFSIEDRGINHPSSMRLLEINQLKPLQTQHAIFTDQVNVERSSFIVLVGRVHVCLRVAEDVH